MGNEPTRILGMPVGVFVFVLIAIIVLSIVLTAFFLRFVFRIKRQLWNQEQQLTILLKMADKLGVDKEETGGGPIFEINETSVKRYKKEFAKILDKGYPRN
jgi:hypothetical protein